MLLETHCANHRPRFTTTFMLPALTLAKIRSRIACDGSFHEDGRWNEIGEWKQTCSCYRASCSLPGACPEKR